MSADDRGENLATVFRTLADETKGDEIVETVKRENPEEYKRAQEATERILRRHPTIAMLIKQDFKESFCLALVKAKNTIHHEDFPSHISTKQGGLPNFGVSFRVNPAAQLMIYNSAIPTEETSLDPAGIQRAVIETRKLLIENTPRRKKSFLMGMFPVGVTTHVYNYDIKGRLFVIWEITSEYDPEDLKTMYVHKFAPFENFNAFPFEADARGENLMPIVCSGELHRWRPLENSMRKQGFDIQYPLGCDAFKVSYSLLARLNLLESLRAVLVDIPEVKRSLLRTETVVLDYSAGFTEDKIENKNEAVDRVSEVVEDRRKTAFNASDDVRSLLFKNMVRIDFESAQKYAITKKQIRADVF